jgi:AcrR family transcriptional regulator
MKARQPARQNPSARDPERTRHSILEAAAREFSDKGLAGARVDAIARRARVNKRMLYHYFGNKEGLFGAVLRGKLLQREALLASAPDDPRETLGYWFEAACRDRDWFRLLGWESLQRSRHRLVQETRRRAVLRQAVAQVRRRQARGFLPAGLDPAHLLLSLMAITAYPLALPQITRLVTGQSALGPGFRRARTKFLRSFGALLRGSSRPRKDRP